MYHYIGSWYWYYSSSSHNYANKTSNKTHRWSYITNAPYFAITCSISISFLNSHHHMQHENIVQTQYNISWYVKLDIQWQSGLANCVTCSSIGDTVLLNHALSLLQQMWRNTTDNPWASTKEGNLFKKKAIQICYYINSINTFVMTYWLHVYVYTKNTNQTGFKILFSTRFGISLIFIPHWVLATKELWSDILVNWLFNDWMIQTCHVALYWLWGGWWTELAFISKWKMITIFLDQIDIYFKKS